MRTTCALLLAVLLGAGAVRAEEPRIPIEVDAPRGTVVTEAQCDWIRAWLRAHLHTEDLATVEVDVRNRTHPGWDFRAEARLAPRVSGTVQVQRVIRFAHRAWTTWRLQDEDYDGDWSVEDEDVVQRVFDLDGERKVMAVSDALSYDTTGRVLRAIARGTVDLGGTDGDRYRPNLRAVWWIDLRNDGSIDVKWGGPWRGTWIAGRLEGDRFVVTAHGRYVS